MANAEDELCRNCEHPKSEHVDIGCNHRDDMGPQEHGNPEAELCTCDGFKPRHVRKSK